MLDSKASRSGALLFTECISLDLSESCLILTGPRPSGPLCGQYQVGGAIAGPDRSLDGCWQSRSSPVAGKKQVFQRGDRPRTQGILLGRGGKSGAALAHDLPWWQLAGNTA